MATRPVFVPISVGDAPLVHQEWVEFTWFPGFSVTQKQRSIQSLHEAARARGIAPLLEISTKSTEKLGRDSSAFNLQLDLGDDLALSVEAAFQGSKVFEGGGPYVDIYRVSPREAKRDSRLKTSGRLVAFEFLGKKWPLEPRTGFYDWLYIKALHAQPEAHLLERYAGFTDIEFNPAKSLNCQARSAAMYVALRRRTRLEEALASPAGFLQEYTRAAEPPSNTDLKLFD